jgi:hypothetical protein
LSVAFGTGADERDAARFRFFLTMPLGQREAWVRQYTNGRSLRAALDAAMREAEEQFKAGSALFRARSKSPSQR